MNRLNWIFLVLLVGCTNAVVTPFSGMVLGAAYLGENMLSVEKNAYPPSRQVFLDESHSIWVRINLIRRGDGDAYGALHEGDVVLVLENFGQYIEISGFPALVQGGGRVSSSRVYRAGICSGGDFKDDGFEFLASSYLPPVGLIKLECVKFVFPGSIRYEPFSIRGLRVGESLNEVKLDFDFLRYHLHNH